jgi:hypothetical protein
MVQSVGEKRAARRGPVERNDVTFPAINDPSGKWDPVATSVANLGRQSQAVLCRSFIRRTPYTRPYVYTARCPCTARQQPGVSVFWRPEKPTRVHSSIGLFSECGNLNLRLTFPLWGMHLKVEKLFPQTFPELPMLSITSNVSFKMPPCQIKSAAGKRVDSNQRLIKPPATRDNEVSSCMTTEFATRLVTWIRQQYWKNRHAKANEVLLRGSKDGIQIKINPIQVDWILSVVSADAYFWGPTDSLYEGRVFRLRMNLDGDHP